ncbi:hypothetical protein AX15_006305 [Amanita polypyramis BW_CC]|nr:hypothetical protein AX15_006305 [Amanita polypyramis BW_CC]
MSLRSRCQQQRILIDRLKAENFQLKKINGEIRNENPQSHQRFNPVEDGDRRSSDILNLNGKRPWNDPHRFDERTSMPGSSSSPQCILNSAGPDRFTFPTHQVPRNSLPSNQDEHDSFGFDAYNSTSSYETRIKSDQLAKQYVYKVPSSSALQYKAPPLSRAQAAPLAYQQRTQYVYSPGHTEAPSGQNIQQGFATYSRPQSRFKPAKITHSAANQAMDQEVKRLRSMGPPPTPQRPRHQRGTSTNTNGNGPNGNGDVPAVTTNRFLPSSDGNSGTTPTSSNRRLIPPPTPLNGSAHRTSNAAANPNISGRIGNTRRG